MQLNPSIFWHISLCFLCPPFQIGQAGFIMSNIHVVHLLQNHPPDLSISGSLSCLASCTSSMLPYSNYLEKSASIVSHPILLLLFYCNRN
jgi:hypothetical protein